MKSINVPASAQQVSCIGISINVTTAGAVEDAQGFVRVKNVGDDLGHIRLFGKTDDGMAFSSGETEYLYLNDGEVLEVVDGEFNIMF